MSEEFGKLNNLEALERKAVEVSKIGGDNAADIVENYQNIKASLKGDRKRIIVVSAIRDSDEVEAGKYRHRSLKPSEGDSSSFGFNTTNHLVAMAKALRKGKVEKALEILDCIRRFTLETVEKNLSQDSEVSFGPFNTLICSRCDDLAKLINQEKLELIDLNREQCVKLSDRRVISLSGFGEDLARDIYDCYFSLKNEVNSEMVSVSEAYDELEKDGIEIKKLGAKTVAGEKDRNTAEEWVQADISGKVESALKEADVVITGGHAPVLATEKGFSEKIAAVVAGASEESGVETAFSIEKKHPLMSIDPSIAEDFDLGPKVLTKISPGMAQNLLKETFANAGAVQASALVHTLKKGVDIFVFNPEDKRAHKISRITDYEADAGGVENVSLRNATTIGLDLTGNHGLDFQKVLGHIYVWALKQGYKILLNSQSGRKVSITVSGQISDGDFKVLQDSVSKKLGAKADRKVVSAVFALGNNMGRPGVMAAATRALYAADVNITGVDQGEDEQAMMFCVSADQGRLASAAIHKCCVEMTQERLDSLSSDDLYKDLAPLRTRHEEILREKELEAEEE